MIFLQMRQSLLFSGGAGFRHIHAGGSIFSRDALIYFISAMMSARSEVAAMRRARWRAARRHCRRREVIEAIHYFALEDGNATLKASPVIAAPRRFDGRRAFH